MNKLTKRREPIFALASSGPIFLNLFFSIYIQNALIGNSGAIIFFGQENQAIVATVVFSILFTIGKVIDALLNIPAAHISDRTKTRWGRRRPCILIGMIGLICTYLAISNPISLEPNSMSNTFYIFVALLLYFASYCLCLESFYASFPEITYDVQARIRLTSWKAFYDTICYSIGYALFPVILGAIKDIPGVNMRWISMSLSPLMLTMIIPLIFIKEPPSYLITYTASGVKQKKLSNEVKLKESVGFFESIKITIGNKPFLTWIIIFAVFYFGLDLFLQGQTTIASSSMGLKTWQITVINTAAFAPIPLMLLLNKKIMNRYGFKVSFIIAITTFILAMLSFMIAYKNWIDSNLIILIITAIGSSIGSFGLTNFFSAPYLVPTQIAKEQTDKNQRANQAMFFGTQGIVVALSNALNEPVWINVSKIDYENHPEFGPHVITYIIVAICTLALVAAFFMPKHLQNIGKKQS